MRKTKTPSAYILTNSRVSVDIGMLYEVSGDDESYIALMVQIFLDNMPSTLTRITESCRIKDWDDVYSAAHFAKSSLSVIKVSPMFENVLTIEGYAKQGTNLEQIPDLIEKLNSDFPLAKKALELKFKSSTRTNL